MNMCNTNNKKKLWLIITLVWLIVLIFLIPTFTHKPENSGVNHSHTIKTIHSICSRTDYKQACLNTMKPLAHKHTMSPKDVLNATIYSVIHAITNAINNGGSLSSLIANVDANDIQVVGECNELLGYALDDLHASLTIVEKQNPQTIGEKQPDIMNWLSGVVAYQETCLDEFNDRVKLKKPMSKVLLNATQLITNALAIVADMPNLSKTFNIPTNVNGRRLLGTDESRYPMWMSVADRRLLASGINSGLTPNAVVAKDGSGQFKTINDALAAYPKGNKGRYVVYVKEGIYDEQVNVTKDHINVFMFGDGATKTIITGDRSNKTGWSTFKSASFVAHGNGFIAKSMGFENTAGPTAHQAVALISTSHKSAFYNVQITGYQDTLYTHSHYQFYSNCTISGTVDFIFGHSSVIIQDCKIISRLPGPGQNTITITAQGRKDPRELTGIVIQHCHIVADEQLYPVRAQVKSYLGRPWKTYSRTVVMESNIDDFIQPDGWSPWDGNFALDTCFYGEYANVGPGAVTDKRVKWKGFKVITDRNEAMNFTTEGFIKGNEWLRETGAPFYLGLLKG